ncbi:pyridoxamine 5'-phosphate oxidase-like FMN-binding protein [Stappia sp. 22II-S9-Z10]|nr:pyridoxamine 5'-phosphate oxidase-like FMN-binding protein [Stappia sp. 22II-S9-Z10]
MRQRYQTTMFTPAVQAVQSRYGSRDTYARAAAAPEDPAASGAEAGLGPQEAAFLAEQDGFFLASVSQSGWPYVQFRGGPKGFLRVLDPLTIGWADFRGNRQYISVGNVAADPRVSLIVLDHARQARIKLIGRMSVAEAGDAPELAARLAVPGYRARVERGVTVKVEAFDWNCPQHITPRFTREEIAAAAAPLHQRIAELEAELAALKAA